MWLSQLALQLRHGPAALGSVGALASSVGGVDTLLRFAARRAFWDFPKTPLMTLAKEVGAPWHASDTLTTRLFKLMHFCLGAACDRPKQTSPTLTHPPDQDLG